jgi:hypothetical protein
MKRIVTAAVVVAALVLPAPAMALAAGGQGKMVLTADGWYYEELPDGTLHSIYISVTRRPGGGLGDLWFTESWGIQVVCDNGTKRTDDDWMGYSWTVREGSGTVVFKINRGLRHAFAEGDIAFQAYAYSDCDLTVEPGVIGGVDPGRADGSRLAPDQRPPSVPPLGEPTLHIVLALDGYGRLQPNDLIALHQGDDARCPGGPDGTRCGGGNGAYRLARGLLVVDDIVFEVEGQLSRNRHMVEPMPAPAEVAIP